MIERTIQRVDVFPTLLPLSGSFRFASGSTGPAGSGAPHVFVRVTDSEGETGWGECRPVPGWSYETLETVTSTLRRYLGPAVIGLPVSDRWDLHRRFHTAIGRGPSPGQPIARSGLDMAVHDLCARVAGFSLRCFLGGGRERRTVWLSFTVVAHEASAATDEVQKAREAGFKHFNFKAAVAPETDVAVARAIRQAAGSESFVWADANQGYRLHEARLVAPRFAEVGVNVLEQPLAADQRHLMAQLRASTTLPLALDEATVGPADAFHHIAQGMVDYFVIKVTRSGGLWPTVQQIAIAESAGLPLLVSGLTEGLLAKLAACQVAAAHGFGGPAALNGSQFIDPKVELALFPDKASVEHDGAVHLNDAPGIGVHPDLASLEEFVQSTI